MNAEEFLTRFERRDFKVLLVHGSLQVVPFAKLTSDDRAAIAGVAADQGARSTLVRLLRERDARARGLSSADARGIDRAVAEFDATLLEIKPAEIRPGVPVKPAHTKPTRKPEAQASLFDRGTQQHQALRSSESQEVDQPADASLTVLEAEHIDETPTIDESSALSKVSAEETSAVEAITNHDADAGLSEPTICALCGRHYPDLGPKHCECGGLLLPRAAVHEPRVAVVAPEAESAEPVMSPTRDEATGNEPLATPEQIAEIMRLAARVFPEYSQPQPEPPIARVNASAGVGSDIVGGPKNAAQSACEGRNLRC
jgi:hypothetical protein